MSLPTSSTVSTLERFAEPLAKHFQLDADTIFDQRNGPNQFLADGPRWRRLRAVTSHLFTTRSLRAAEELVKMTADEMVLRIRYSNDVMDVKR